MYLIFYFSELNVLWIYSLSAWFFSFSSSTAIFTASSTNFRLQGEFSSSSRTTFNVTEEFLQRNTSNPETQSTEPNQNQNNPNIPSTMNVLQKMLLSLMPQSFLKPVNSDYFHQKDQIYPPTTPSTWRLWKDIILQREFSAFVVLQEPEEEMHTQVCLCVLMNNRQWTNKISLIWEKKASSL